MYSRSVTYALVCDILSEFRYRSHVHGILLQHVTEVLDRSLKVPLIVLEELRHVCPLQARVVSFPVCDRLTLNSLECHTI